jgi:hypothetical protein
MTLNKNHCPLKLQKSRILTYRFLQLSFPVVGYHFFIILFIEVKWVAANLGKLEIAEGRRDDRHFLL